MIERGEAEANTNRIDRPITGGGMGTGHSADPAGGLVARRFRKSSGEPQRIGFRRVF